MTWLLRLKRELGLIPPADGLCGWSYSYVETYRSSTHVSTEHVAYGQILGADGRRFSTREGSAVPLTAEEWPRFVELLRTCGPESVVTAPSVWVFVQERNAELGGNPEIHKYAGEMLTIFDRRR